MEHDPGRELDARIAEHLIGLWCKPVPFYSANIAAAWLVVEHMASLDLQLSLDMFGGDPWWCEFANRDYTRGAQATAPTAPLAICRAALEALNVPART